MEKKVVGKKKVKREPERISPSTKRRKRSLYRDGLREGDGGGGKRKKTEGTVPRTLEGRYEGFQHRREG